MAATWVQDWAWAFTTGAWALWFLAAVILWVALLKDRSRGRRRCPKCWYDMTGVPGRKCPECGREAKREKRLFATRRRWRLAAFGIVVLVIGVAAARVPRAARVGAWAMVPVPVLNFVLGFWDKEAHELVLAMVQSQRSRNPLSPASSSWERLIVASYLGRHCHETRGLWTTVEDLHWVRIHSEYAVARPGLEEAAAAKGGLRAFEIMRWLGLANTDESHEASLARLVLDAEESEVREEALNSITLDVPRWLSIVRRSKDDAILEAASGMLSLELQQDIGNRARFRALLTDPRPAVVRGCLKQFGRAPSWAAHEVAQVLRDSASAQCRLRAAEALSRGVQFVGEDADFDAAYAILLESARHEKVAEIRAICLFTLGDHRHRIDETMEVAYAALRDGDAESVFVAAIQYIIKHAGDRMVAVQILIARLDDTRPTVIIAAARSLTRFGRLAAPAADRLSELMSHEDPRVSTAAWAALTAVPPP